MPKMKTRLSPIPGGQHCHYFIARTAQGMARELYEIAMRDNNIYKEWKAQCPELTPEILEDKFVLLLWPKLIEQARATLAKMLRTIDNDTLKNQIHDALVLDASLRRGRPKGQGFRLGN